MKDYPLAQWLPSPNFTRGRSKPVDRVVVHITDGQPRLDRCVEHLRKPDGKVSAHFLVGRQGEVVQLVRLDDTAWHASGVNAVSVGIEHVARTPGELDRRDRWAKLDQRERSALLDPGAPAELQDSPTDPGLQLTPAQLEASVALVRWLCDRLGLPADPLHVVPHCSVPGTTHNDCGRDVADGGIWPWAEYFRRLGNSG